MGLAIDGNVVHGIARGGQPFLAMQANKDGSINLGDNLYAKQDPIVGKKIYVNEDARVQYLSGDSFTTDADQLETVLAVLKDGMGTYYFFQAYEKSSGQLRYAYVPSEVTRMANS